MRSRFLHALAVGAMILSFTLTGAPVLAQQTTNTNFGNQTVPVEVQAPSTSCNPQAGTVSGCFQAPANAIQTPIPITSPAVPTAPNLNLQQGTFATLETNQLMVIEGLFTTAINVSVVIGERLFLLLAFISLLIVTLKVLVGGEGFAQWIKLVYWRIVEGSLWLAFIGWTWKGPGGMDGWFPMVIGTLAFFAGGIVNGTAGTNIVTFTDRTFHFILLPGSILDLGGALLGVISNIAWAQLVGQPSNAPGAIGAFANGVQTVVALVSGAVTGTLLINIVLYVMMMLTGIYVYAVCAWISYRYFIATIKIFMIACAAFLQGFAAVDRLAIYSGGFLTAALRAGMDFFYSTLIIGVFYGILTGILQNIGVWPFVQNLLSIAEGTAAPAAVVHVALSLGTLIFLDIVVTMWAWAMRSVPKLVNETLSGHIDMSQREAASVFQNSATLGGRIAEAGTGFVQDAAERGPYVASYARMQQMMQSMPAPYTEEEIRSHPSYIPQHNTAERVEDIPPQQTPRSTYSMYKTQASTGNTSTTTPSSSGDVSDADRADRPNVSDSTVQRNVIIEDQYEHRGNTDAANYPPTSQVSSQTTYMKSSQGSKTSLPDDWPQTPPTEEV